MVDEERSGGCADTANSSPLPARARSATQTSTSGTSVSARQPRRRLEAIPARTTEQLTRELSDSKKTAPSYTTSGIESKRTVRPLSTLLDHSKELLPGSARVAVVKSATSKSPSSLVRTYGEHDDDDGIRSGCQRNLKTDHHAAARDVPRVHPPGPSNLLAPSLGLALGP